jgi:hypothetical protein
MRVTKIFDDEFLIEGILPTVFNESIMLSEDYKYEFKHYMQEKFKDSEDFPGSRINIELINATEYTKKGNETLLWVKMKTFDILITETDLILGENTTIFDVIFDNFYFDEFKKIISEDYEENNGMETTTTDQQISSEYFSSESKEMENEEEGVADHLVEDLTEMKTILENKIESEFLNFTNLFYSKLIFFAFSDGGGL